MTDNATYEAPKGKPIADWSEILDDAAQPVFTPAQEQRIREIMAEAVAAAIATLSRPSSKACL